MDKNRKFPEIKADVDHFKDTKLIILYARQLKEENQNFTIKITALKNENEGLKEYNKSLLQTNINIGSDESVTLLYAQLRVEYGNLLEEHEKLNITYQDVHKEHFNLKEISSKIIKNLEVDLKVKTEKYEHEITATKRDLEQQKIHLQIEESKVTDLQFNFDKTFNYYNERNDRLTQENNDLKCKMTTLNKLNEDSKTEIMILKKRNEQQFKKYTDLEDKLYNTETQLKSVQDKLQSCRPNIPTYGNVNKTHKSYHMMQPTKLSNVNHSSYRSLNISSRNSISSLKSTNINNESATTTMTSNNSLHFDSINLENALESNNEMLYNVNLNVTSKSTSKNARKLLTSSTNFNINDSITSSELVDDPNANASSSNVQDDSAKRRMEQSETDENYLDMAVVKGMYSNMANSKKRSRKLFDPEEI